MKVSERIFKIMGQKGMNYFEFSKRTGIAQSTISDWKTKGTNPRIDKLMKIAKVLDVSVEEILQDTS